MSFKAFVKIPRLSRDIVVTEKIDGTNAQIHIVHSLAPEEGAIAHKSLGTAGDLSMFAGSRTRYITPENDNYGFARWGKENAEELWKLGSGQHFGEWWGNGIQRGYGLKEKRFSLFNVHRWGKMYDAVKDGHDVPAFPACCHVVPVLGIHTMSTAFVDEIIARLVREGSSAAPGFMKPEGVIVFHTAASQMFKRLIENDDVPKGQS